MLLFVLSLEQVILVFCAFVNDTWRMTDLKWVCLQSEQFQRCISTSEYLGLVRFKSSITQRKVIITKENELQQNNLTTAIVLYFYYWCTHSESQLQTKLFY